MKYYLISWVDKYDNTRSGSNIYRTVDGISYLESYRHDDHEFKNSGWSLENMKCTSQYIFTIRNATTEDVVLELL